MGPLRYGRTAQPCRGCCPRLTVAVGWVLGQDQTAQRLPIPEASLAQLHWDIPWTCYTMATMACGNMPGALYGKVLEKGNP